MTKFRSFGIMAALATTLQACGTDSGSEAPEGVIGVTAICEPLMAKVDSFMNTFTSPTGERYGGTVVTGNIGEVPQLGNPLISSTYEAAEHQTAVLMMTLIRFDADLEPIPYLAERWEVADDFTSVTFFLRNDVYWHDGEITDATDVAFAFDAANDPEIPFPNKAFWTHYTGYEILDDFTIRFDMEPHAEYLDPWRAMPIVPQHILGGLSATQIVQHPIGSTCPVGNGPFRFRGHVADASWTFDANPAFPEGLGGRPYVDRYVYRIIPEEATLLAELMTGSIDIYFAPRPDMAEGIEAAANVDLRQFSFRNYVMVVWNSRKDQLKDPRVRQAITMATNRMEFLDGFREGYGTIANAGVPPFHFAYDPAMEGLLSYDPEAAAALLTEAGWEDRDGDDVRENADGIPLSISVKYNDGSDERRGIAIFMQEQLRQVGIDLQPVVVEWGTLIGQINDPVQRDFDGVVIGWVSEFKVDDKDLFHSDRIDEPFAWAGTENAILDDLIDRLPLVVDREESIPLWLEYQEAIVEEQPFTFFYFPDRLEGINTRMRDVVMDVRGEWFNIREWWIDPAQRR